MKIECELQNTGVTMPGPADVDQHKVLVEVWKFLKSNNRWPRFRELDILLDRFHNLQAERELRRIPRNLVGGVPDGELSIPDDQPIWLTVAGVHATEEAADVVDLFLRTVQLAVNRERAILSADEHVRLSSSDIRQNLGFRRKDVKKLLPALRALLGVEPWGWTSVSKEGVGDWVFDIDGRSVRRFREAVDLPGYWAVRDELPDSRAGQGEATREIGVDRLQGGFGQLLPIIGAVPGLAFFAGTATLLDEVLLRVVTIIVLAISGTAMVRWYRKGLRWRRRRWWTTLTGGVLAALFLAWTFLPVAGGDAEAKQPGESSETRAPGAPQGACIAGVTCRYLRLSVGQGFDLDGWRMDEADDKDIGLVDIGRLAPWNGGSLSPAVPAPDPPLDPRACWTAGEWEPTPQSIADGMMLCVRTAEDAHVSLVRLPSSTLLPYDALFLVAVATPDLVLEIADGAPLVVDNRVTAGMLMREDKPAYLTSQPKNCGHKCALRRTELHSGAKLNAVCQTTGEDLTNGHLGDPADDDNPELDNSAVWYKILWPDGRAGYLSAIWVRSAERDGLNLPVCR